MRGHLSAVCLAILPLTLTSVAASAEPVLNRECWNQDELSAAQIHSFKTMLMVGSIKCRELVPSTVEGYNLFIDNKRDFITSNQYVVVSHFIKKHGVEAGITSFRNYDTSTGNLHSGGNFLSRCESIATISRLAANASDSDLRELARVVSNDALTPACPTDNEVALAATMATAAAPLPVSVGNGVAESAQTPPAEPAVVAAAAQPAVASVSADLAPVAAVAIVAPASVPEPAKLVEAPAPTAAQALQDAARALALAATALQAQSAAPAAATPTDVEMAKAN